MNEIERKSWERKKREREREREREKLFSNSCLRESDTIS